ncbi:MAG TPA: hypothetical protein VF623_09220 [Segetibacter sp.]
MNKKILSITGNTPMNYILKTTFSNNYNLIPANNISSGISKLKTTKNVALFIIDADFETQESIDFIKFVSGSGLYSKPMIVLASDKRIIENFDNKIRPHCFLKPFDPVELIIAANNLIQKPLTMSGDHLYQWS